MALPRRLGWTYAHKGAIDLSWFGAELGLGVRDCSVALAEAFEAAAFYSTEKRPSTIVVPNGTYAFYAPIVYEGRGEALDLVGQQGGQLAFGGTIFKCMATMDTLFTMGGVWRGAVKRIDFIGNSLCETIFWLNSLQASGGEGTQGYLFDRCGFLGPKPTAPDPVGFRIGATGREADQIDLCRWFKCQFYGNSTDPEAIALWKQMAGGNTLGFTIEGGEFKFAQYGIDANKGSGNLSIKDVTFLEFKGVAGDGSDAAAMRIGTSTRASVRDCTCENSELGRFIQGGDMGSTALNGLIVESCVTRMESPDDDVVIDYRAPLTLRNNTFGGHTTNITTVAPRILVKPLIISVDGAAGEIPGSVISEGNSYGYMAQGSFAPFYNDSGTPVAGLDSYSGAGRYYGMRRCPVFSRGDGATKSGAAVAIALEPWDGSIARNVKTWNPGNIADGATETVTHTWEVTGILASAPVIGATFSELLPAGMSLSAGRSGTNEVWAKLTNNTGGAVDLASGTLTFTARAA